MQEDSNTYEMPDDSLLQNNSADANQDEDGRDKEWQDRARVNPEQTPEGIHTNVERDFEPENLEEAGKKNKEEIPQAY